GGVAIIGLTPMLTNEILLSSFTNNQAIGGDGASIDITGVGGHGGSGGVAQGGGIWSGALGLAPLLITSVTVSTNMANGGAGVLAGGSGGSASGGGGFLSGASGATITIDGDSDFMNNGVAGGKGGDGDNGGSGGLALGGGMSVFGLAPLNIDVPSLAGNTAT